MTWAAGFAEYVATSYEVRLHRRRDTFGGVLWPERFPGLIGPGRQLQIAVSVAERRVNG